MSSFSYSLPVEADVAHLWALMRDVQRVASLFPYTSVDDFRTLAPDRWVCWRRVTIPSIADLRWREETWMDGEGTLRFTAVEGDLDTFDGRWQAAADAQGARLTLAVDYVIPEALRPRMPASMVEYVMGELLKSICRRIKEAAEEAPA